MDFQKNSEPGTIKRSFSKRIIFFLILLLLLYLSIWMLMGTYVDIQAGTKVNYFHEIVGGVILFLVGYLAYTKFYNQSLESIKARKQAVLSAENMKKKEEAEEKKKADAQFVAGINFLKAAETLKDKYEAIDNLIAISETFIFSRQPLINYLLGLNAWMKPLEDRLRKENLLTWRLKQQFLEDVDVDAQKLSMKVLGAIESILKSHCVDFKAGKYSEIIDLSSRFIPALNLANVHILKGCINFSYGKFYQCSFWESNLEGVSFKEAKLNGANFWKSTLKEVDFGGAVLKDVKLKTDLSNVLNLNAENFFTTKDWKLNILSEGQIEDFFKNKDDLDPTWEAWSLAEIERNSLFGKGLS